MENESVFDDTPEQDAFTRIAEAVEGLVEILKPYYHVGSGFAPIPIGHIPVEYIQKTKTFPYTNSADLDNDIDAWLERVKAVEILNQLDASDPCSTMGRIRTVIAKVPKPLNLEMPPENEIVTEEFPRI